MRLAVARTFPTTDLGCLVRRPRHGTDRDAEPADDGMGDVVGGVDGQEIENRGM
jgi:hypothetical protein